MPRGDRTVDEHAAGREPADLHGADGHVEHGTAEQVAVAGEDLAEQPVAHPAAHRRDQPLAEDDREDGPHRQAGQGQDGGAQAEHQRQRRSVAARGGSRSAADSSVAAPITWASDAPNMLRADSSGDPVAA